VERDEGEWLAARHDGFCSPDHGQAPAAAPFSKTPPSEPALVNGS
jgi:hypothetical protein